VLVDRGQKVLALPFVFLGLLFTYAVVAAWAVGSFHVFMSRATHENYLPLLVWSYGVACGPWAALTEKERRSGGSNSGAIVSTSLGVAYLVTALVVIFGNAAPMTWLAIFLAI